MSRSVCPLCGHVIDPSPEPECDVLRLLRGASEDLQDSLRGLRGDNDLRDKLWDFHLCVEKILTAIKSLAKKGD